MRMRKGKGGSILRTAVTGSNMALYRYFSSAMDNPPDSKEALSKKMHVYVAPMHEVWGRGIKMGVVL